MLLHFNALQRLFQNETLIRKAKVSATKMVKSIKRKKKLTKELQTKRSLN